MTDTGRPWLCATFSSAASISLQHHDIHTAAANQSVQNTFTKSKPLYLETGVKCLKPYRGYITEKVWGQEVMDSRVPCAPLRIRGTGRHEAIPWVCYY